MRKLLSLIVVLALLAVPAWADGPTVKFSFIMPASEGNDPLFNALDPDSLFRWELAIRGNGDVLTLDKNYREVSDMQVSGVSRGIRLRLQAMNPCTGKNTPLGIDLAWIRGRRLFTSVRSATNHEIGTYHEQCPWAADSSCYSFGIVTSAERQTNFHQIDLHTFRFGFRYDLLYRFRYASLEPGIGVEWLVARHVQNVFQTRTLAASPGRADFVQDGAKQVAWTPGNNQTPYLSLDAEVFPFGKRGVGIGISTRYLPDPMTEELHSGSLAGPYGVPLRQHRWSTSLTATFIF